MIIHHLLWIESLINWERQLQVKDKRACTQKRQEIEGLTNNTDTHAYCCQSIQGSLQAHKPSSDCVVPRVTEELEKGYACKVDSGHLQAADHHNL